jgi:hypothetical protein
VLQRKDFRFKMLTWRRRALTFAIAFGSESRSRRCEGRRGFLMKRRDEGRNVEDAEPAPVSDEAMAPKTSRTREQTKGEGSDESVCFSASKG